MIDYDQLEFRHLKYLQAIAEEGTITAASARVHITQSAISTQIKQLEELFDIVLLHRERDGVTLTPHGEILLAYGRDLLQGREDVIDMLNALRTGDITSLRLGFSALVEKKTLETIISATRRIFPYCKVLADGDEIEDLEARVGNGELDGALVTLPIEHNSDLMTCTIAKVPLVVCMRADDPLAAHEAIPAHLLTGKLGIFQYQKVHRAAYSRLLELFKSVGIEPRATKPTTNREHIQWTVLERQGYALVREGARLLPGLTTRPIHGAEWTIDTALILKPTSQHPALAMLLRDFRKRTIDLISIWVPQLPQYQASSNGKKKPKSIRGKSEHSLSLFEAS
ncbi:LysR family transcriptional regulator [Edaphobacter aggregans]|uniref:LysR family transcriptional regulator n=1 Tax=Edaphobacter aggregans TaxID=570835 RepID=UPI00054FC73D|nr:LysR family transcriptional regulator [Edaphobacter aggregans]